MRAVLAAVALVSVLLAGCLGGDDSAEAGDGDDLGFDAETGALTGRVVREDTVESVPGVRIRLIQDGTVVHQTETDGEGQYAISRITPGTYRLEAFHILYKAAARTVTIDAGAPMTQNIPLILNEDGGTSRMPYHERDEFVGFFSCTISLNPVLPASYSPCPDDKHKTGTAPVPKRGLRTMNVALHWTNAPEFTLVVKNTGVNPHYVYLTESCTSPCEFVLQEADLPDAHKFSNHDDEESPTIGMNLEVFAPTGLTYQQEFTLFWAYHYWEPAPAGFSVMPDQ
jgi:hypothetical protein